MAEYHTVYKGPEGETTQWEDIQIKLGNMAPKPKPWKPDAYKPEQEEQKDKEWLDKKDEDELSELEDEFQDDKVLEEYRCSTSSAVSMRCTHNGSCSGVAGRWHAHAAEAMQQLQPWRCFEHQQHLELCSGFIVLVGLKL